VRDVTAAHADDWQVSAITEPGDRVPRQSARSSVTFRLAWPPDWLPNTDDYTAKLVVRGGVEPPTFGFQVNPGQLPTWLTVLPRGAHLPEQSLDVARGRAAWPPVGSRHWLPGATCRADAGPSRSWQARPMAGPGTSRHSHVAGHSRVADLTLERALAAAHRDQHRWSDRAYGSLYQIQAQGVSPSFPGRDFWDPCIPDADRPECRLR